MPDHDALRRLSELAGILPDYLDLAGTRQVTADPLRRDMLSVMGIACATDADCAAALRAVEEGVWRRRLPPVQVVPAGTPPRLLLRLPERQAGAAGEWRLWLEDGSEGGRGVVRVQQLDCVERREIDGEPWLAGALELPAIDWVGYHRFELVLAGETLSMPLIVHPPACYQPPAVEGGNRVWGVSVQLYGVRSSRNWGIGDLTDLRHLMEWAATSGAGMVGINPLHALFPHNPLHASPYSPSSREFVNPLYLDVEAVPEFADCDEARALVASPDFQAQLRGLRAATLVDHAGVAAAKLRVLDLLYRHFRDRHLNGDGPRARAFRDYVHGRGGAIERFAVYHALQEHLHAQGADSGGWPSWPSAYRDAGSAEVAAFAAAHRERVEWFQYLQWLTDAQLDAVGARSLELGLGVGLYQDLAVAVDAAGAETWSRPELYARQARIGSPPDDFNPAGQDWGMPPWLPEALRAAAYVPFVAALRANMRAAGALRIDHVMSLARLYWVLPGKRADQGAYVAYPLADLLGILALESQRNRCLVVGEDLGTVPEGLRETLRELGVLSHRLFFLERDGDGSFLPPQGYPQQALVAVGIHDLPTLAGFWRGSDLDLRATLGLFADEAQRSAQVVGRAEDRARLLMALEREGLLPEGLGVHPVNVPEMTPALVRSIHRYLARSPARLALVQAEDMLGEVEQANLPGTTDQHPNWQRKLSLNLEEWVDDPRIPALAESLVAERGRAVAARTPLPFPQRPVRAPRATYRLQLHRDFDLAAARALVSYLADLGISDCYCSPYLKARPGSRHGYDITDHTSLNPEVGSEEDLRAFSATLAEHGMGQILDMVPNHMGIMGADNHWWMDVLENGEASPYAEFFDIDWHPVKRSLRGKVLVPVLGDHYGNVLERGELRLAFDAGAGEFSVWYYEHRFPVDPRAYPRILSHRIEALGTRMGGAEPLFLEFQSLTTGLSYLPAQDEADPQKRDERARDAAIHKRHLADLVGRCPDLAQFLRENLDAFNGRAGEPSSFDPLHELLLAQAYRLAYWRVASDEINYRRFFDINDLAALRMERQDVFEATHRLIFRLLQQGVLSGLRIDHSDGLFAPAAYFERLQHLYHEACPSAEHGLYVVVEKILAHHERLPQDWAISGTTGYEAAISINGLFVDGATVESLERIYRGFVHEHAAFDDILYRAKRVIMKSALASELNVLANRLLRIAELDRHTRDYTLNSLRTTLMEIVACFPVYRTYLCPGCLSDDDRRHVEWACTVAKKRASRADTSVYDFVRDALLGDLAEGKNETYRQIVLDFGMRMQQFTSPVMAKGMEDTTFYRYLPLAAANEVGGEPRRMAVSVAAFHHANLERARLYPHTLLAGSTHDSKRAEDVRARIDVLSEMPERWRQTLRRWHRINRAHLGLVEGGPVPSRRDEYLLYQTLLGTWPEADSADPDYVGRIDAYMVKAVREAKEASSWTNANADYEAAMRRFIEAILIPAGSGRFVQELAALAAEVAHFGRLNGLAQTLLRLTLPGVPDIYQGSELWNLSLVDPDNRRPVDYDLRRRMLAELAEREARDGPAALCAALLDEAASGAVKLYLISRTLRLRRAHAALFESGDYRPVTVEGSRAAHLCAFARVHDGAAVLVVVPRLAYTLLEGRPQWPLGSAAWDDTRLVLPGFTGTWREIFGGQRLSLPAGEAPELEVAHLLTDLPVALLVRQGTDPGPRRDPPPDKR